MFNVKVDGMMNQQLVRTIRLLFPLFMVAMMGVQSCLSTRAMTTIVEHDGQQRSKKAVATGLQTIDVATPACNEIHILIRTPTEKDKVAHNFQAFFDLLVNFGYKPTIKAGSLSSNDLTGYDVVLLTITTQLPAITVEEVGRLQGWVNAGGALFVLYEGGNDQRIANTFGVNFGLIPQRSAGIIVDTTDSFGYPYNLIAYQKDNFSNHSIMQDIRTLTTWTGFPVMGAGEPLVRTDTDATPAGAAVARAMLYGKGRALFLGDEAVVSLPVDDNPRFLREALYWLANGVTPEYPSNDNADDDGDGLSNATEVRDGWDNLGGHYYTNPCDADSDDDGLTDGEEWNFDSHPHRAISGYYDIDQHKSYDQFQQPTFWGWSPALRAYQPQQWAWEMTTTNKQSTLRGMLIKGQVWGPEIYGYGDYGPVYPRQTLKWVNWGGIEIQVVTRALIGMNNGIIQGDPNFYLFVKPIGQSHLSWNEVNVEADFELTVEWTTISDNSKLIIADTFSRVVDSNGERTLSGATETAKMVGNTWGFGTDGKHGWTLNQNYLTFGFKPSVRSLDALDRAGFATKKPVGDGGQLFVKKRLLIDSNRWHFADRVDSPISFVIDTPLDLGSGQPPPCTEVLEIHLSGQVDWRIGPSWDFTPEQVVKTNYIDEKLYAVLISNYYTDPTHPLNNMCNNRVSQLLNPAN